MNPIVGFLPDADPVTPGVVLDCSQWIPFDSGYQGAPSAVSAGVSALAAACRGAAVATKLDGTRRLFAGTQTKLYELSGTTWTDRSAGGGSYTGSTDSRWSFCQFGDTTIASNLVDNMQSSASGAFAAISGAPKAAIVISASNNFVIAFNTNEGTYGASPDRWWCCAQSDQTNWTPSVATGATTGRLVASEGPITSGLTLGDYAVAYKTSGIYLGSFVGATNGSWQWNRVVGSENCGAVGLEACCDIGGIHFIRGNDDFYLFDGTRPVSIGAGVRRWFIDNSSRSYLYLTRCVFDKQRSLVWVNFASKTSTGALDKTIVYHVEKKQWGLADHTSEAAINFISPSKTFDDVSSAFDSTDIAWDAQYWLTGGRSFGYFDSTHTIVTRSGVCGASSFTTGDVGDDDTVTILDRMRVRFTQSPSSATATGLAKFNEGDALVERSIESMYDGRFDLRQSGRFHRVRVDMVGDHKETAYDTRVFADAER